MVESYDLVLFLFFFLWNCFWKNFNIILGNIPISRIFFFFFTSGKVKTAWLLLGRLQSKEEGKIKFQVLFFAWFGKFCKRIIKKKKKNWSQHGGTVDKVWKVEPGSSLRKDSALPAQVAGLRDPVSMGINGHSSRRRILPCAFLYTARGGELLRWRGQRSIWAFMQSRDFCVPVSEVV